MLVECDIQNSFVFSYGTVPQPTSTTYSNKSDGSLGCRSGYGRSYITVLENRKAARNRSRIALPILLSKIPRSSGTYSTLPEMIVGVVAEEQAAQR
jgi:hypothetical protein